MKIKNSLKLLVALTLCLTIYINAFAQNRMNSPYSMYGVGDLHSYNQTTLMAMGGLGFGVSSPLIVNFNNPASYHAIEQKSFLFEASSDFKFSTLKTTNRTQKNNYAALGYLTFAFPINRQWKTALGLTPYSDIGYAVVNVIQDEEVGRIQNNFAGSGGLSQFFVGNAFSINKNFAVGLNLTYLFGNIEKSRSVQFPDSRFLLNTRVLNTTRVSDIMLDIGLQYHYKIDDEQRITFGLAYTPQMNMNVTDNVFAYNFVYGTSGIDNIRDTLILTPSEKGVMVLPTSIGGGLAYQRTYRLLIKADYLWQNWENYSLFDDNGQLNNSMVLSVGAQVIPESTAASSYLKRVRYRFGIRYNKTYLEMNNTPIDEFGISFGFGLPMPRSLSSINIGMEAGNRGTTDNNLISDTFFRLTIGVSVHDRWFEQRKYY